jgi:hypothetical protein
MKRNLKELLPVIILALVLFVLFVIASSGQNIVATGGSFTLEKAVVAGGGIEKPGATMTENGTTGQAVAGYRSDGGGMSVYSGFWTPDDLMPTAEGVSITGRVATTDGMGIRNVMMTLTSSSGETMTTYTGGFGNFSFVDVRPGRTYLLSAVSTRYQIEESTRVLNVNDDLVQLKFIAEAR